MAQSKEPKNVENEPKGTPVDPIEPPGRPLTVREAGRRGGGVTAARHGQEFFQSIGRKGGQRVRELIARARAAEEGRGSKE